MSFARYTAEVAQFREEEQRRVTQQKADLLRGPFIPTNAIITAPRPSSPASTTRATTVAGVVVGGPTHYETPAVTELGSDKAEATKLRTSFGRISTLTPRTKPVPLRATVTHIFRNPPTIVDKENVPLEVQQTRVLPGYTGHIPQARDTYAVSFGSTVRGRPQSAPSPVRPSCGSGGSALGSSQV